MSLFTVLPRLVVSAMREVLGSVGETSPGVAHEQYRPGFSFSSHGQLLDEGSSGVEDISSDSEQEPPIRSVVKGKPRLPLLPLCHKYKLVLSLRGKVILASKSLLLYPKSSSRRATLSIHLPLRKRLREHLAVARRLLR